MTELNQEALNVLFLNARTFSAWQSRPVADDMLKRLYEMVRMGPTSANSQPVRLVFVKSPAAKERLKPAVAEFNIPKVMAAPVTAIVAMDTAFYEKYPALNPHGDWRQRLESMPATKRDHMAFQGSCLQGAYLIMAARSLGLDCGPMGGFDNAKVDATFFPDGKWKSNFLLNMGYGDTAKLHPRLPRLTFEEACRVE